MYRENPAIFWTHDKTRKTIILRTRTHYEYACTFAWFLIAGSVSTAILDIVFSPQLLSLILTGKTCKSAGSQSLVDRDSSAGRPRGFLA